MLETSAYTTPPLTIAQHQKAIEYHRRMYAHHNVESRKYDGLATTVLNNGTDISKKQSRGFTAIADAHHDLALSHKGAIESHKQLIKKQSKPKRVYKEAI